MLRTLRARRRPRYGAQVCALIAALLLLLSVSLLHTRLSQPNQILRHHQLASDDAVFIDPLLSDSDDSNDNNVDKIDELDTLDDNDVVVDNEEKPKMSSSSYYFDHLSGSIRRAFNKRSIDDWDFDYSGFTTLQSNVEDKSKTAFGSDDFPVDDEVRRKMTLVKDIEDALLLKTGKGKSPLREKWGEWFDKKGEFLRRDKMFKSHLEVLNPMNNPLLQDPDGVGISGLTRGDKVLQKLLLNEFKLVPFIGKKPLGVLDSSGNLNFRGNGREELGRRSEIKRAERRTLDDSVNNESYSKRVNNEEHVKDESSGNATGELYDKEVNDSNKYLSARGNESSKTDEAVRDSKAYQSKNEFSSHIYADGKRWGYYPGLHPRLSFSNFMDAFFRKGKCDMRVFMVWNSPPWMYSVRHQRGLESVLFHHRDACVVVFSETIELDFFKDSFVKDGFKVAVAMPNLDELLKDTPAHEFASVWFEWRKTKFYNTHYSELVRLAALYKYGGIYMDSDIIVLKSLSSLNNSVGMEDKFPGSSLNGAVMAFRKHSPFILECLKEFYLTYDETRLRWNGADLLQRVARRFWSVDNSYSKKFELNVQPSFFFFPISPQNISRYFVTSATESEKAQQDALFKRILGGSLTFHFWNSMTSALIPEPESLVARLIDKSCIHCFDVL
ncbi:hypothetical protein KPL71_005286 [Citrus sinensis]|uniref:Uncharacterized protein n=2 Tax=Citrus sinensis TaxID=2711 RepID=A0ACB8NCW2_CITSI|nr:hypothetical protein KPL71_005286 [Citrus sinensis]KDO77378.1 hypothetical protein CISIN_1g005968mg [Citrus sinensis]